MTLVSVDLDSQILRVFRDAEPVPLASFPISSGIAGIGFENNSGKTPTGNFRIAERFGRGLPVTTIFKSREAVAALSMANFPQPLSLPPALSGYSPASPHLPIPAQSPSRANLPEFPPDPDADLILSRILWLDGLDPDNANTKARYIYIHGTHRTDLLGVPASHGCIRMHPADVAVLESMLPDDARIAIHRSSPPPATLSLCPL